MHRYVGVLFALLAVNNIGVLAAGNIGCLFSDTLCELEREWCFDDHAFGHCLPDYGHYREEDLHRYELGSDELRLLEQEMQRLFLLGYRWSHTYTQCVLQELLHAIRRKIEFDISSCNGDVDQDLEGALRAIEGEELVDPRDLAIVRFTPSATDPHSDYADEVYFPPIKDQLLQDHPEDQREDDHQESPTSEPGESGRENGSAEDDSNDSPHHQQGGAVDSLSANPPGPPPNAAIAPPLAHDHPLVHDPRQQNYLNYYGPDDDEDDYDDDATTYRSPYQYQPPLNPVYRKRSRMEDDNISFLRDEKLNVEKLRKIASLLDNLSEQESLMNAANERVLFPERLQKDEDDEDIYRGVFDEEPTRPMYTEGGRQFVPDLEEEEEEEEQEENNLLESPTREAIWSNMPQDVHVVPEGLPNMPDEFRNMPGVLDTILGDNGRNYLGPFRNLPGAMQNVPRGLLEQPGPYAQYRPQYARAYEGDPMMSKNSINRLLMQDDPPFEMGGADYAPPLDGFMQEEVQNIFPRNNKLSALQAAFGPQLNSIQDYDDDDDYNDYPAYDLLDEYGDYGHYDDVQLPYKSSFPFLQKLDKKDEETAGGDYDDMVPASGWSFQRNERLDVKKPGPGFDVNNFAFDDPQEEQRLEEEFEGSRDSAGEGGLLLSRLLDAAPISQDRDEMLRFLPVEDRIQPIPDLLLADEGVVDEASDDVIPVAKAEKLHQDKKKEDQDEEITVSTVPPTEEVKKEFEDANPSSYVYITIDRSFVSLKEGDDLARTIGKLTGLDGRNIDHVRVNGNQVTFHIKDNEKSVKAADVAAKANELQRQVEPETGLIITNAGVDTKTAMSAMVFSPVEKHILAAAAIVCGVMAALVVAASVLYFLRRHAKSKAKLQGLTAHDTEASKDYQDLCRARMAGKAGEGGKVEPPTTHAPSQRVSSLSRDSDNGNNSPSSRSSTSSCEEPVASNMDISTGHMVLSYMEDHLKNKDRLEQEWIALCAYEAEPCATTLAMKPENNKKNRYPDAVPYDHNRVILNAHTNINGSDYINASSIQTDHDPRNPAYIATQGPLNTTASDFWQMVWEQGSVVIVMLTRLTENGHAFCHRYWPEEGSDLYHIYEVHLVSEHIWCDDYLVRSFYLKNVKTGETRTVTQFHFLSWPDSGTPASTKALLEFRRKVNKSYRGRSCPIIVHCSDGIGRTGTYSLIDMVLNRMAKGAKEIDIAATLEHIRDQRPHMVKSKAQFEFVLMAVAEEVHAILKALPQ